MADCKGTKRFIKQQEGTLRRSSAPSLLCRMMGLRIDLAAMRVGDAGLAVEVGVDDIAPFAGMGLLVGKARLQAGIDRGVEIRLEGDDFVIEAGRVLGAFKVVS